MGILKGERSSRFLLVTAAHQFLLDVLPFRGPESHDALTAFVEKASGYHVSSAVVDAVLLRCLTVLNKHTGNPLPSLIDSYISRGRTVSNQWIRFTECVSDAYKYRGIGDISVQQAIAVIEKRYHDPGLAPGTVAGLVMRRPAALSVAFKRHTGMTLSEYLRRTRLDQACKLLTMSMMSIKEVWSKVGYNYGSNFDHDFKRRFGTSPSEYRSRAIHPRTEERPVDRRSAEAQTERQSSARSSVLIVDHAESTRWTISQSLRMVGYAVFTAASGREALREVDRISPHAMLLEYHLPDMSGLDCLRALRQTHSMQPAVGFLTADWDVYDDADEIHSLNGIVASKLCDLEEINELVARLLKPAPAEAEWPARNLQGHP